MKRGSTIFLQVVMALLGVGVLALLLWEPQVAGRNVNATLFEIYFKDPFLAYIYLAFVPFFVGLYQAFKILGYARRNEIFSQHSVRALRTIKYCALTTAIFIVGAEAYIFIFLLGGVYTRSYTGCYRVSIHIYRYSIRQHIEIGRCDLKKEIGFTPPA